MAVNITMEKCDRCGTCISVCPVNALMLLTEALVVDAARCTGCGVCVSVCPFGALVVSPNASSPSKAGTDHG